MWYYNQYIVVFGNSLGKISRVARGYCCHMDLQQSFLAKSGEPLWLWNHVALSEDCWQIAVQL